MPALQDFLLELWAIWCPDALPDDNQWCLCRSSNLQPFARKSNPQPLHHGRLQLNYPCFKKKFEVLSFGKVSGCLATLSVVIQRFFLDFISPQGDNAFWKNAQRKFGEGGSARETEMQWKMGVNTIHHCGHRFLPSSVGGWAAFNLLVWEIIAARNLSVAHRFRSHRMWNDNSMQLWLRFRRCGEYWRQFHEVWFLCLTCAASKK